MEERPVLERFFEKLGEQDPKTGCIEWLGHHDRDGYARIWDNDRKQTVGVARLIYTLLEENGTPRDVPFVIQNNRLQVGQACGNFWCCNRFHWYIAARSTHMRIAMTRGTFHPKRPRKKRTK